MNKLLIALLFLCSSVNAQFGINIGYFETGPVYTNEFVTEWEISSGSFTFPAGNLGTYNATIDWGDSTTSEITAYNDADLTHTYSSTGTRTIIVSGTYPWFYIGNNASIRTLIKKVIHWGNVGFLSLSGSFHGTGSLDEIPEGAITGISSVTDFNNIFRSSSIPGIPSGFLDNATSAQYFINSFLSCTSSEFDSIPNNLFDNCTDVISFQATFRGCVNLSYKPTGLVDNCDQVTSFSEMFMSCSSLGGSSGEYWLNPSGATNYTLTSPDYDSGVPNGNDCYRDCTSLTDYASIPTYWK